MALSPFYFKKNKNRIRYWLPFLSFIKHLGEKIIGKEKNNFFPVAHYLISAPGFFMSLWCCCFLYFVRFPASKEPVIVLEEQLNILYKRNCYDMPVAIVTIANGERCLSGTNLLLLKGTATTRGKTCLSVKTQCRLKTKLTRKILHNKYFRKMKLEYRSIKENPYWKKVVNQRFHCQIHYCCINVKILSRIKFWGE